MKLIPVTNFRPNIKFTGEKELDGNFEPNKFNWDDDDDDEFVPKYSHQDYENFDEIFKKREQYNIQGKVYSILFSFVALTTGALLENCSNNRIKKEFADNVANIIQSDNIKQDTFTVKDVTDDEKPDLILYKNDGSKVVIDIANQEISEE